MSIYTPHVELVRFNGPDSDPQYSGCLVSIMDEGGGPYIALTTGDEPVQGPSRSDAIYFESVEDIDDFAAKLKALLNPCSTTTE
jgi:hypothetical protein